MNKNIPLVNNIFERVLAVGAHPDDIELGCFGTLAKLKRAGSKISFIVTTCGEVGGGIEQRREEAIQSAAILDVSPHFGDLSDTAIPEGHPTIKLIEDIINEFKPTAVFVHSPNDTHQDHRNVSKATISAARFVPAVFFYQTPSSTRFFNSNFFINISDFIDTKIDAVRIHKSQGKNAYMADQAVRGLSEFLGLQIYQGGQFYEGFEIHQIII